MRKGYELKLGRLELNKTLTQEQIDEFMEAFKNHPVQYYTNEKQVWISVLETNINWPDEEVLGFDGESYMVGKLGCDKKGNVYVQDEIQELLNITHYQLLTKP